MKKLFLPLLALLFSANAAFAQDAGKTPSNWTHGGNFGINFAQSYFNNWAAGGQNTVNGLSILKYSVDFIKDNSKWENDIDLQLGYSFYDLDKLPIKTDDKIYVSSLYGYDVIKDKLFITSNLTLQSQFANGYDYKTDSTNRLSGFLSPGYVTLGFGAQWVPAPCLSINIAPVTGKLTVVKDQKIADLGNYGMEPAEYAYNADSVLVKIKDGSNTRWELGLQFTANFKYEICKNVTFNSKLVAFYDYMKKSSDTNALGEKYRCTIDFDWDNSLILKVNDWLNCNITARMLYDEDIHPTTAKNTFFQFKEVLSVGISYRIP
ncbi:MAG: DUF3078 domain-containing protein [Candidatus Limimorpha sp.]